MLPPEVKKAEKTRGADAKHPGPESLLGRQERVMGLEPTTATLATWRSTTELHPLGSLRGNGGAVFFAAPHLPPNYKKTAHVFKRSTGRCRFFSCPPSGPARAW